MPSEIWFEISSKIARACRVSSISHEKQVSWNFIPSTNLTFLSFSSQCDFQLSTSFLYHLKVMPISSQITPFWLEVLKLKNDELMKRNVPKTQFWPRRICWHELPGAAHFISIRKHHRESVQNRFLNCIWKTSQIHSCHFMCAWSAIDRSERVSYFFLILNSVCK